VRPRPGLTIAALAAITCCFASSLSAQTVVSGLQAQLRSGQVFLTWKEVPGSVVTYHVYRSTSPIDEPTDLASAALLGSVGSESSKNQRNTLLDGGVPDYYAIEDLGPRLLDDDGLFVHTIGALELAWYAVIANIDGNEDTTIVGGGNATLTGLDEVPERPLPVLQRVDGVRHDYVHWVSDVATPFAPAMWFSASQAFNLRINYDALIDPNPRPTLVRLHFRDGNYQHEPEPTHPEAIMVSPDDWFETWPNVTYWYGANPLFPDYLTYPTAVTQDYTVRRVLFELDYAQNAFPADLARTYLVGVSMGAMGSAFLAYRHPERFAAAHLVLSKFDMECQLNGCWWEFPAGWKLWGPPAQNGMCNDGMLTYDRLDLSQLVQNAGNQDLPPILSLDGRQDEYFGWAEKPTVMNTIAAAEQSAVFLWDNGTHIGPSATAGGLWAPVWWERFEEMWRYRIDQAFPVFTSATLDSAPGNGDPLNGDLIGTINGYIGYDTSTIVDEPGRHELTVFLRSGMGPDAAPQPTATLDWRARRLQAFQPEPGQHLRFRSHNVVANSLEDDRIITVTPNGSIRVPETTITTAGNRWELEPVTIPGPPDLPHPPYLMLTGLMSPGTWLDIYVFGEPGWPSASFWGTQSAFIPIDGFGGALQIADPVLHGQAFIGPEGKRRWHVPLSPAMTSIIGVPIQVQGFSGLSFTNVVELVLHP
jgi:pimeloyl-ACP methyl ester carboxylesterase